MSLPLRQLALQMLASWDHPSSRDVGLGAWRPVKGKRSGLDAVNALRAQLNPLLNSHHEVRLLASQIAAQLGLPEAADGLVKLLQDSERSGRERAGALLALEKLRPENLRDIVDRSLEDSDERVRAAARVVLAATHPRDALPILKKAIQDGQRLEQQAAIERLAFLDLDEADAMILDLLQQLKDGKVPAHAQLDVLAAAQRRQEANKSLRDAVAGYQEMVNKQDKLGPYRVMLEGGDAERGRRIFMERINLACLRCHVVGDVGGRIGPELTKIGADRSREELLQSIVDPNAEISKDHGTIVIETKKSQVITGIESDKTDDVLSLTTAEGEVVRVVRDQIKSADRGNSIMPVDLIHQMSPYDLRDLLEYLSQLQ
jgi:quinoprotein glucose dehydrogenase